MNAGPIHQDNALDRPELVMGRVPTSGPYFVAGFVLTEFGVVGVRQWETARPHAGSVAAGGAAHAELADPGPAGAFGTELAFVCGGRTYRETHPGLTFPKQVLLTAAYRFARRVVRGAD